MESSLSKIGVPHEKGKVLETDTFTGKQGSEIEDFIPVDLIVDSFDRLFRPEEAISVSNFDLTKPIVPQIEAFAKDNHITIELGWKVAQKECKCKIDEMWYSS